jgi:hypothetical protein
MTQYGQQRVEQPISRQWMRASTLSGLAGGILMTVTGLALLTVLNEAEFEVVEPLGAVAMLLLALALPALYASERHWFGRLASVGYGLLAVGWTVAAVGITVTAVTLPPVSEFGFLAFLLGLLAAGLGMLGFGVAALRTDEATIPRLGAWFLVAALPAGVPFAIAFTTYVMGEGADPWAGPMLLYGLAWILFGRALWARRPARVVETETVTR